MNGRDLPWQGWGHPVDAWALGAMGAGLALLSLALLLVPQRLAQRPASQGIVSLRLARDGQVRLWNQAIPAGQLGRVLGSLEAATPRPRARPTLRLVPDADVPWGTVQQLVEQLSRRGLPLELQLP